MTIRSNIVIAAIFGLMVSKVTAMKKNEDVIEKIRECDKSLALPFDEEVTDRAQRFGKKYTDKI